MTDIRYLAPTDFVWLFFILLPPFYIDVFQRLTAFWTIKKARMTICAFQQLASALLRTIVILAYVMGKTPLNKKASKIAAQMSMTILLTHTNLTACAMQITPRFGPKRSNPTMGRHKNQLQTQFTTIYSVSQEILNYIRIFVH